MKLPIVMFLVLATGCDPEAGPCDPGQTYAKGLCYTLDAPSSDGAEGADGAEGDAGAPGFGTSCTTSDECGSVAAYCAIQPGAPSGYCTHTGCVEDPGVCPPDWGCLNLSMFDPGLPSICTQP